jgi:circadian clock protein KaiC
MGDVEKIPTGVDGLDDMLYGGIPINNQMLVAGGPGAGKTLLTFEILYRNAKRGVPSVFIPLEEDTPMVLRNVKEAFSEFDDLDDLVKSNMIEIDGGGPALKVKEVTDSELYSFGNIVSEIESLVKQNNSKIVVIDSVSMLKLVLGETSLYRKSMMGLISTLRRLNVTSLFTSELPSTERESLIFSPEFFMFDGVLNMYQIGERDKRNTMLEIVKTRGSNHSKALTPYDITPSGFKLTTAKIE